MSKKNKSSYSYYPILNTIYSTHDLNDISNHNIPLVTLVLICYETMKYINHVTCLNAGVWK